MNDEDEKLLVAGGVVLGVYFLIVKPILSNFTNTPDNDYINQANLPAAQNPFSPSYQPLLDNDPSLASNQQLWYAQVQQLLQSDPDSLKSTSPWDYRLAQVSEVLYYAFPRFFGSANATTVIGLITGLRSKQEVAYVSGYIYYNYGKNFMQLLNQGNSLLGLNTGVGTDNLDTILKFVNSLPESADDSN